MNKPSIIVPYYSRHDGRIICEICPRFCSLKDGQTGFCRSRRNINNELIAINYGETASIALDPIEKKPLYNFFPGNFILSAGPNACSFSCKFCQNWQISQEYVPTQYVLPSELAQAAKTRGSIGLAYTYSEPLMWYEFLLDCCDEFHRQGMVNVLVTNGYINPEPFRALIPLVDAMNIDLKSIENDFYLRLCGGVELQPVLDTIRTAYEAGIHVELTQLLIPGENDSIEQIEKMVEWVSGLSSEIPLHFSRYYPVYKHKAEPTGSEILLQAHEIASKALDWVYIGNIALGIGDNSHCPECNSLLVRRRGYSTDIIELEGDRCGVCGKKLYFRNSG